MERHHGSQAYSLQTRRRQRDGTYATVALTVQIDFDRLAADLAPAASNKTGKATRCNGAIVARRAKE